MPSHLIRLTFAKTIYQHFLFGLQQQTGRDTIDPMNVNGCSSYSWECVAHNIM